MVPPDAKSSGAVFYCFLYFQDDISIAFAADLCVISSIDDSLDNFGCFLSNQAII